MQQGPVMHDGPEISRVERDRGFAKIRRGRTRGYGIPPVTDHTIQKERLAGLDVGIAQLERRIIECVHSQIARR